MTLQVASLIRRSSWKQHGTENNRSWLSTCSQVIRPWRLKVQHGKPCHTFKKLDVIVQVGGVSLDLTLIMHEQAFGDLTDHSFLSLESVGWRTG